MCGIAGAVNLRGDPIPDLQRRLEVMNQLLAHRGPDDEGVYLASGEVAGLGHRRLSILDLSEAGHQPMLGPNETAVAHNGEIYNFVELREQLSAHWDFHSQTDTEVILAAYARHQSESVNQFRGMFAFAVWDDRERQLFCARDRFGIKPFFYTVVGDVFYFASEVKALIPFLPEVETDAHSFSEYLAFQYTISERTLFKGVQQLLPGHALIVRDGRVVTIQYWDVVYDIDKDHNANYFRNRLRELVDDSIDVHLRSDVPVGSYISGGIDSSLIGILAGEADGRNRLGFHGKFTQYPGYDESEYAEIAARDAGIELHTCDISADDFERHIGDVIYHLDYPIAGPGSFPQYMVSKLAAEHRKVVLGGQGGDEIFGGYARYMIAYLEQCIKAAIDGTYQSGNFIVTIESIVPNLGLLREYKPLLTQFWRDGLFGPLDERYFRLVNRANDMPDEVRWEELPAEHSLETFKSIFNNRKNVAKEAYFDSMTHFDFKCLLPALLHVEDRMSMAHGLESRVPLLDHAIVEFAASVPADVKFEAGHMKHLIKTTYADVLPRELLERRDKMGFPVPLKEWFGKDLRELVLDTFNNIGQRQRPFLNADAILNNFDSADRFSRKHWALLSLELWHQRFHDQAGNFRKLLTHPEHLENKASLV